MKMCPTGSFENETRRCDNEPRSLLLRMLHGARPRRIAPPMMRCLLLSLFTRKRKVDRKIHENMRKWVSLLTAEELPWKNGGGENAIRNSGEKGNGRGVWNPSRIRAKRKKIICVCKWKDTRVNSQLHVKIRALLLALLREKKLRKKLVVGRKVCPPEVNLCW